MTGLQRKRAHISSTRRRASSGPRPSSSTSTTFPTRTSCTSAKPSEARARFTVTPCASRMLGLSRTRTRAFMLSAPSCGQSESAVDRADIAQVPRGVEALVELLRAELSHDLGVGGQEIVESGALPPCGHGIALDHLVGILPRETLVG